MSIDTNVCKRSEVAMTVLLMLFIFIGFLIADVVIRVVKDKRFMNVQKKR